MSNSYQVFVKYQFEGTDNTVDKFVDNLVTQLSTSDFISMNYETSDDGIIDIEIITQNSDIHFWHTILTTYFLVSVYDNKEQTYRSFGRVRRIENSLQIKEML